jgi:hypothetical protein
MSVRARLPPFTTIQHFQTHSRSKTVAKPCPTPTQSDAMPREAPVRAIWWISVEARRAPLRPSGGPIAIAPPLTFNFASSYAPRIRRIDGSRRSAAAPTQTQPNQPPNLAYRVGEGELVGT